MKALVPTCNRPGLFARLVKQLDGFEVIGFVNNSTAENIAAYRQLQLPKNARLIFTNIAGEPKTCHVHTFRLMMQMVADECIIIEDDVLPCNNFCAELRKQTDVLKQRFKNFTLSPLFLPYRNSDFYTGLQSRKVEFDGFTFIDQAWVDGNFYMTKEIALAIKNWILERVKVYRASSGVGRVNSKNIVARGWKMFTTVPTLVEHLDQHSVMFGQRRQEIPLIARFGVDDVVLFTFDNDK